MQKQDGSKRFFSICFIFGIIALLAVFGNSIANVSYGETIIEPEEITLIQDDSSKFADIAKKILDGSFVNSIISNEKVIKGQGLGLLSLPVSKPELDTVFSGDKIVLQEEEGTENIIVEEPQEELQEDENKEITLDENGVPTRYVSYIDCKATAYCLCKKCTGKTPGSPGYGRTASGYVITPGIGEKVIAVDKNKIKLGSKVYVQGLNGAQDYGFALAADTGGAIKSNKIDLYMDSHADCLKWGRREVRVYILPEE